MICRTCEELQEFNAYAKCEDCLMPMAREPDYDADNVKETASKLIAKYAMAIKNLADK